MFVVAKRKNGLFPDLWTTATNEQTIRLNTVPVTGSSRMIFSFCETLIGSAQ